MEFEGVEDIEGGAFDEGDRTKATIEEVASALGEVICSQQAPGAYHDPTPTEYFAAILGTLSSSSDISKVFHLGELLVILEGVIPDASSHVVRSQFAPTAGMLLSIVQAYEENAQILRLSFNALGALLRVQEKSDGFWSSLPAFQTLNAFLTLIDDERVKLRKSIHSQLTQLLAQHAFQDAKPVRSYVAEFCLEIMRTATRSNYKRALFVSLFLESSISLFSQDNVLQLFGALLQLREAGQPMLTAAAFRSIDAGLQSPQFRMTTDQIQQLLAAIVSTGPDTADMESNVYYYASLASGLASLDRVDRAAGEAMVPKVLPSLINGFETPFVQIHTAVGAAMKRVLQSLTDTSTSGQSPTAAKTYSKFIAVLCSLFQLRYQQSWFHILDVARYVFQRNISMGAATAAAAGPSVQPLLLKLGELFQGLEERTLVVAPDVEVALRDALGFGLQSVGLTFFLATLPLAQDPSLPSGGGVAIPPNREWIISILDNNLRHMRCQLSEFQSNVQALSVDLAGLLTSPSASFMSKAVKKGVARNVVQLWSLFPGFCLKLPLDVLANFPSLAPDLLALLADESNPEITVHVVAGLTHLATAAHTAPQEKAFLGTNYAKDFLPALLGFLERRAVHDSHFQSGVHAVSAWTSLAPAPLVTAVSKKLFQVILSTSTTLDSDDSNSAISGWISVVLSMLPFLPTPMVALLYKTVRPLLSMSESLGLQKRGYLVLEALLRDHPTTVVQTDPLDKIVEIVSNSLLTCHVSARNMRLRCIHALFTSLDDAQFNGAAPAIFGEVLLCIKDANKKCRDGATAIVRLICRRLPSQTTIPLLCSGVVGETPTMRSAAVLGMSILMLERRDDPFAVGHAPMLAGTVFILIGAGNLEQTRAVLSFIRVLTATLPPPDLERMLPALVTAALAETSRMGQKDKFLPRIRAIIRKLCDRFGGDALRPLVPEDDLALIDYVMRRTRKAARKKREKEKSRSDRNLERMLGSDSDGSSDDDEEAAANAPAQDIRLASRPRAVRATSASDLPGSLEELLEREVTADAASRMKKASARAVRGLGNAHGQAESDDDEQFKVVVNEAGHVVVQSREDTTGQGKLQRQGGGGDAGEDMDVDLSEPASAPQHIISSGSAVAAPKRRVKLPGEEYRSKKSSGDVWKRGMLEPHAYIPLDARMLSKKNHGSAVAQMGAVIKSGRPKEAQGVKRKGVLVGNRNQRKAVNKAKLGGKPSKK